MDAVDHGRVILSAIIPSRRDLLDKALQHLVPEHFTDTVQRNLWSMVIRYAEVTGQIIAREALSDLLRGHADPGKVALYEETFDAYAALSTDEAAFRWSLQEIRDLAAEQETAVALAEGAEILKRGVEVKGELVKGHEAARSHVLEKFAITDRELSMQTAPEGDARREGDEMMDDYAERKRLRLTGRAQGILFGIPALDARIGGLQPGDLDLIVGYSSDGKTSLSVQLAWSAAVEQGKNVVIMTTETLRPQVRRKLLSRHSKHPMFELPDGLNSRDLKQGTLTDSDERILPEIIRDFTKNPTYGSVYIAQVPRGATIGQCESRLYRIARELPSVDLVVIDYLRLLRAERHRQSDREELGAIIVEGKALGTTFNDGAGVPVVSPWQVNRSSRDEAERVGYYTSKALGETAEATNTSDVIVSILAPADNEARRCEIKAQILKNRDGETANSIPINVDYATSCFTSATEQNEIDGLLGSDSADDFSGLLTL